MCVIALLHNLFQFPLAPGGGAEDCYRFEPTYRITTKAMMEEKQVEVAKWAAQKTSQNRSD
ncbi:hypothetical protein Hanom_Chr15g01374191 [Helianthus anomalus]